MITKVKTENGDCWAITFHNIEGLDTIARMQYGLIDLMNCISSAEPQIFMDAKKSFYESLCLLKEMLLTDDQVLEIEKLTKTSNVFNQALKLV